MGTCTSIDFYFCLHVYEQGFMRDSMTYECQLDITEWCVSYIYKQYDIYLQQLVAMQIAKQAINAITSDVKDFELPHLGFMPDSIRSFGVPLWIYCLIATLQI